MKNSRRQRHASLLWILLIGICVGVAAPTLCPATASAIPRKESSEPLMGDPDTPEAPKPNRSGSVNSSTLRTANSELNSSSIGSGRVKHFMTNSYFMMTALRLLLGGNI